MTALGVGGRGAPGMGLWGSSGGEEMLGRGGLGDKLEVCLGVNACAGHLHCGTLGMGQ